MSDRGGFVFDIKVIDDELIMNFGREINWIGFNKKEVKKLIGIFKANLKKMKDKSEHHIRFNFN